MTQNIDIEMKHPYCMPISCGIGVGKTTCTENLLKYRDEMISPSP